MLSPSPFAHPRLVAFGTGARPCPLSQFCRRPQFPKTYLLVGMTGDLGRLICHWMITRGARSVVLTSRSPHVDPLWLEEMSALGALVTVMAM